MVPYSEYTTAMISCTSNILEDDIGNQSISFCVIYIYVYEVHDTMALLGTGDHDCGGPYGILPSMFLKIHWVATRGGFWAR